MRVDYTEDEDFAGQFGLWQANCDRSARGRKGQAALREMKKALLAMPVKRIARYILVEPSGEVCAIGALMVQKKIDAGMSREKAVEECSTVAPYPSDAQGVEAGMPRLVAWSVAVENDSDPWDGKETTPEQRYDRMLAWVQNRISGGLPAG